MPESPPTLNDTEPVPYMERTRRYYEALGYGTPYRWARFDEVPFTRLTRPLSRCRLALVGTARPVAAGDDPTRPPPRIVASVPSTGPVRLYTADLAWDKETTHTADPDSFFPRRRLQELAEAGTIGSLAARAHSAPTEYSQRKTHEVDAPEILRRCRQDGADAALLVPL